MSNEVQPEARSPYDTYWSRRAIVMENTLRKMTALSEELLSFATTCCVTTRTMRNLAKAIKEADAHLQHAERDTGPVENPPQTF